MQTLPATAQIAPAALACAAGYVPLEWTGRGLSAGHDLQPGYFGFPRLLRPTAAAGGAGTSPPSTPTATTPLRRTVNCATESEAQAAGIAWVRRHCEETLAALKPVA